MIRTFAVLVKRPDISFAQFSHYWLHEHIPSVAKQLEARGVDPEPNVPEYGYHQNHGIENAGNLESPYAGYSEFWLDNEEDWEKKRTSERVAVGTAEEYKFLSCNADWYATSDRVVVDGVVPAGGKGFKILRLLSRKIGTSKQDFRQWWQKDHATAIRAHVPGLIRYEQHQFLDSCYNLSQPRYDGFETLWVEAIPNACDPNESHHLSAPAHAMAVREYVIKPRTFA